MTYVEVYSISRQVMHKITSAFPEATRLVRRGTVLMIARRGLLTLVKDLRKKQKEQEKIEKDEQKQEEEQVKEKTFYKS